MPSPQQATTSCLTSGMRGPSSSVRARRHRAGRCSQARVTLGCAVTRSLRWLPLQQWAWGRRGLDEKGGGGTGAEGSMAGRWYQMVGHTAAAAQVPHVLAA